MSFEITVIFEFFESGKFRRLLEGAHGIKSTLSRSQFLPWVATGDCLESSLSSRPAKREALAYYKSWYTRVGTPEMVLN